MEDFHDAPDISRESNDQDYMDPIEYWFHITVSIHFSFLIRQIVASHQLTQLVPHVQVFPRICFSNLKMNNIIFLLHTWMNWNYPYT